ncbi:MAG: hypothetical protein K2K60_05335 [Clostridia bacterium]|nr:hypothetical protein [Clostridia bacterium]
MKKLFIAVLTAVCIICLGLAVACAPKYYAFTFEKIDGIEYVSDVVSGAEVKKGYTVTFTLKIDEDSVKFEGGEPQVTANGNTVTPNDEGVYSVTVKSATKVTVANANPQYKISFRKAVRTSIGTDSANVPDIENGVFYSSNDVNVDEETTVEYGTKISFTVRPSVYCKVTNEAEGPIVLADSTIIVPDDKGVYTVEVKSNTTIQVRGLEQDSGFTNRKGGGAGTAANPYKIAKPIDLFLMAGLINDDYWIASGYQTAYYEMTADIDLQGEQLYIIGDMVANTSAFFAGDFNGSGHTIKNYYINDFIIDQENYVKVDTPYIGVFGVAYATRTNQPSIYNVNLENFTINANAVDMVNANGEETGCCIGGLIGSGIGAVVTGCSVNGKIDVVADDSYMTHVGGVIGMQTSAYDASVRYYSTIRSCSSSVNISGRSGLVYNAGGITGYLISAEARTTAFILNSYSTGDVLGAVHSGGIAGMVTPNGSIGNCYNTGYVEAHCRQDLVVGYEDYAYAYAGGIAGYADTDTVIYNCFAAEEEPYAYSVNGDKYGIANGIACTVDNGGKTFVETQNAILLGNVVAGTGPYNKDFFINTLKWNEGDWTFSANGYPQINLEAGADQHNNSTVTIDLGGYTVGGQSEVSFTINDNYIPMSFWNIRSDGVAEFLDAGNGVRTYGYFFDEELTQKVPYGFVPTCNITLYTDFADYSQVAGKYYLQLAERGSGAYIELKDNGELVYRYGALFYTSYYTYNDDFVLMYDCPAFAVGNDYYAGKATVQNGEMTIINWASSNLAGAYTQSNPLTAVNKINGFNYGVYYTSDGTQYVFSTDRTIIIGNNTYTYEVSGNTVNISNGTSATLSGGTVTIVGSTSVTALDVFAGTWEKSASSHKQYTFDGKGNWTYEYFGYRKGVKVTLSSANGTYSYNGDRTQISFTHDGKTITVNYNENEEFLVIGNGSETQTYYREYSYAGTWHFFNSAEPIDLTLGGINQEGYGLATATYGSVTYDLTYAAVTEGGSTKISLYSRDVPFGTFEYSIEDGTLKGDIYSNRYGAMYSDVFDALYNSEDDEDEKEENLDLTVTLCLYDDFRGIWISEKEGFEFIEFNGLGSYDLTGDAIHSSVNGQVKINGRQVGYYKLEDSTLTGSFVYDSVKYEISYDEINGKVKVTEKADEGDKDFILQGRDSWYNVSLTDGENAYTFDGRGEMTAGGKMTVTDASGVKTTYTYNVSGTGVTISGGASGSIVLGPNDDWTLTLNGTKQLSVNNGFEGNWFVGGNYGVALNLTIGKTGRSNTATGTFDGKNVTFEYNPDGKYLVFTTEEGETYYVKSVGEVLQLGITPDVYITTCIPWGQQDSYLGVYKAENGTYFTMDGLGNPAYGTGLATVFNTADNVLAEYYYTVKDGIVVLTDTSTRVQYRFIKSADGMFALDGSLDKYSIVKVDIFFGRMVADANDKTITYIFDGLSQDIPSDNDEEKEELPDYITECKGNGTVVASNGKTYTYKQLSYTPGIYTLLLTDENGKEYEATFVFDEFDKVLQVSRYILTLKEKTA